jgi:AraC family transcriptional regulator of adaptative response / DNA-3-methyladenine glycosylase II
VRAILGQQISVAAATTLAGRLVERFGAANPAAPPGLDRTVPEPARVAAAGAAALATIGLPAHRARTRTTLAEAVAAGSIDLSPDARPSTTVAALVALPGIGPWTANYIAMRALAWPDAFLGGDLIVRRALDVTTATAAERLAEPWRPWRAYAVLHLWSSS